MSHEREISTQHPLTRNRATRLQRRVEAVLRLQFCQGQSRGEQLHVRSRNEILVGVLLVQRLAALGIRDKQSPLTFVRGRCSQQRFRPRGEFRRGLLRSRTLFLFDGAPRYCAPVPKAHTALATATAALRCRIFSILIFHSRLSRSPKSIVQWQRIPSPARLIYRTNPCLKPVGEASFLRPEVAPSLRAL